MNIPLVTTFHGTYGTVGPFKKYYNSIMLRGDCTIAISNFIAEHISSVYGKMNNMITTTNGAPTNKTSGKECLDLFTRIGNMRWEHRNRILEDFETAFKKIPN